MKITHKLSIAVALASCAASVAAAQSSQAARADTSTSIAARTRGMEKHDGFIPVYVDPRQAKILLEIPRDSMRALWFVTQATGLGSNPIGVDRGSNGDEQVVRFDRNGDRMLVVFENWRYRSSMAASNPAHARSVAEAFPPSTVASLPVVAAEGGRALVDATDLLMRDWTDAAGAISLAGQGNYSVARDRSSVYRPYTKAFPTNTEIDLALTFALASGNPGAIMRSTLPDAHAFTLRQHVTLLQLPDDGYQPRALDPRVGYFDLAFKDYAQPIQGSLEQHWIERHRLERVNPSDPNSPIKNPIVYYIDRGIPEPIRTATVQGVSWWIDAFDRAGLKGAFRVEDLPDGANPMDARYNVVQWENRNERGWSVGGALADPRTGEMIKGMARLDSHRARTDYNLFAGLFGADATAADTAFVLARVRQVSAHEVGHTLGLAHNYIASTYERASVMDYPPPRVTLDKNGNIDVSDAYAKGPGVYDVWAIHWGYGIFPPGTERDSLASIVADGLSKGYAFLSDADARPDYASDPRVNLWDDASSASEFLSREMAVRRVAMSRFGLRNIRPGEPVALLQERFAPVYLMHRFAINSLAKTIGGMEYSNAVRGDNLQATRPIAGPRQRAAIHQLASALQPAELAIPDTVLRLLAPRPYGYQPYVELFRSRVRPAFDELGAVQSLASLIVNAVLQPERAGRLVQFAAHSPDAMTLGETIDTLVAATWKSVPHEEPRLGAVRRVARRVVLDRLLEIAADTGVAQEARAITELRLASLKSVAANRSRSATGDAERASWDAIEGDVGRWLNRRELPAPTRPLAPPPGDPFGLDP